MSDKLSFIYDSKEFVDLYEILKVEIDADEESIKSSYIKLAKKIIQIKEEMEKYFKRYH